MSSVMNMLNANSPESSVSTKTGRPARPEPDFQHDGITFAGQLEMTFQQWCEIPDHPHQRDTLKHSERARHLRHFSDTQRKVSMGILPDGRRFKGDGHTRTHMWKNNLAVGVPTNLKMMVDTFNLRDERALAKFYDTFDNRSAVDTVGDQVFSAAKAANITFESPMLRSGRFASAVRVVYQLLCPEESREIYSLRDATAFLANELKMFDSIIPTTTEFTGGFAMAALLSIVRDGERAVVFWKRYQEQKGWKNGDQCDAVEALINFRAFVKSNKQAGGQQNMTQLRYCLTGYLSSTETPARIYTGKKAKPRGLGDTAFTQFVAQARKVKKG